MLPVSAGRAMRRMPKLARSAVAAIVAITSLKLMVSSPRSFSMRPMRDPKTLRSRVFDPRTGLAQGSGPSSWHCLAEIISELRLILRFSKNEPRQYVERIVVGRVSTRTCIIRRGPVELEVASVLRSEIYVLHRPPGQVHDIAATGWTPIGVAVYRIRRPVQR